MIRGFFRHEGAKPRPFVVATFNFGQGTVNYATDLLIDTGADRTLLAPRDTTRLRLDYGIDLTRSPRGAPSTGVGGSIGTFAVETTLILGAIALPITLAVIDPPPRLLAIPSILGRDVLSRFALYLDQPAGLVRRLEPHETAPVRRLLATLQP